MILKRIESVEILKQGFFTKSVKKIKYKNKIYKISSSINDYINYLTIK